MYPTYVSNNEGVSGFRNKRVLHISYFYILNIFAIKQYLFYLSSPFLVSAIICSTLEQGRPFSKAYVDMLKAKV